MTKERGKISKREWQSKHQGFETGWWGDCANTYGEETKQLAYAKVMGMDPGPWQGGLPWPHWDLDGMSVLDVGGGPASMLLKCSGFNRGTVVDPGAYPEWTKLRYREHGIEVMRVPAEEFQGDGWLYSEAWLYNVLQHTIEPEAIIRMMRRQAKVIRIFEWVDAAPSPGHPHVLKVEDMQEWAGGEGSTFWLDEQYNLVAGDDDQPEISRNEQKAWGGCFEAQG